MSMLQLEKLQLKWKKYFMEENLAIPGSVEVELGEFRVIPGPKGETGERGPRGYGIESAVLNPDYTLTLKFEDGSSFTTGSIRGADGTGISSVEVTPGENYGVEPYDTLKIGLTDGKIEEFKIYNAAATSAEAAQAARTGAETACAGGFAAAGKSCPSFFLRFAGTVRILFRVSKAAPMIMS